MAVVILFHKRNCAIEKAIVSHVCVCLHAYVYIYIYIYIYIYNMRVYIHTRTYCTYYSMCIYIYHASCGGGSSHKSIIHQEAWAYHRTQDLELVSS
jgi:hypothetical protein